MFLNSRCSKELTEQRGNTPMGVGDAGEDVEIEQPLLRRSVDRQMALREQQQAGNARADAGAVGELLQYGSAQSQPC